MTRHLRYRITLLFAILPAFVWAEGSKQLTPNTNPSVALTDAANTRAGYLTHDANSSTDATQAVSLGFLKPYSWTGPQGQIFSEDYRMHVHMEPGETMFYGVHRLIQVGSTTVQNDLILTLRYGTGVGSAVQTTTLPRDLASTNQSELLPAAGVIASAAQTLAGPLPNSGGYAPLQYTNTTGSAQEFYVEFTQVNEANLSVEARRSEYDFWDFTVRNSAGVEKPGRLYSKHWGFSAGTSLGTNAFQNRLAATFNLYPMVESVKTPGKYFVKQVELAGMRPLAFYFVSNEFGSTYDATTRATTADRQKSQTTRTSYPQYPNFVNNPDEAIWPSAATPTVSVSAANYCRNSRTEVAFTTRSDETGAFDILIDLNGNGVQDGVDVLLQQMLVGGTSNTIIWNGKNNVGVFVAPTGQPINYNFISKGATINFPVFDAEGNPDGFRVRNARPANVAYDRLYWDDSRLTNFVSKTVQLTGTDSQPGVHIWGISNDEGNGYTVNSWTYGFTVFQGAKTFAYTSACDNDGDGVANETDIDDDNDGILDVTESFAPAGSTSTATAYDPSHFASTTSAPQYLDGAYVHPVLGAFRDANSDGINDIFDVDMDGIPNHFDLDADGDGLTDAFEANGNANPVGTAYTYGPFSYTVGNGQNATVYTYQSSFDITLGRFTTSVAASGSAAGVSAGVGPNGLPDAVETSISRAVTGTGSNEQVTPTESSVSKFALPDNDGDKRTTGGITSINYNFLDIDSDNDGITDNLEAQLTIGYRAPSGLDADKDGIDNTYDPTPGGSVVAGMAITMVVNTDGTDVADMFDTDADNDNAGNGAKAIYQQTADWSEGFDVNGNGLSGDEIVAKARLFATNNPEKAAYYAVAGPFGSTTVSGFLQLSRMINGDKIPNFLDPTTTYYHDDNFNGLVDLYDPAYGGSPSTAPKRVASQTEADYRTNSVATPLPVELTEFTVRAVKKQDAQLAWRTASEKNNDHFDVERSLTGTDFVKISQVKGQGTSSTPTDYALTDIGIGAKASGVVYYRLKQVDTDGTATFSPVRTVSFANLAAPAISLSPNPATDATQLDLTQLPTSTYQVRVLDVTGRLVLGTTLPAGLAHALDLRTIDSGTYVVLVRGLNGSQVLNFAKRLVKE